MIRITVDLISAVTGEVEKIAWAEVVNDGTGTETGGNYKFELGGVRRGSKKKGRLVGFKRTKNVWWLLFYCLKLVLWEDAETGELVRTGSPQSFSLLRSRDGQRIL